MVHALARKMRSLPVGNLRLALAFVCLRQHHRPSRFVLHLFWGSIQVVYKTADNSGSRGSTCVVIQRHRFIPQRAHDLVTVLAELLCVCLSLCPFLSGSTFACCKADDFRDSSAKTLYTIAISAEERSSTLCPGFETKQKVPAILSLTLTLTGSIKALLYSGHSNKPFRKREAEREQQVHTFLRSEPSSQLSRMKYQVWWNAALWICLNNLNSWTWI